MFVCRVKKNNVAKFSYNRTRRNRILMLETREADERQVSFYEQGDYND